MLSRLKPLCNVPIKNPRIMSPNIPKRPKADSSTTVIKFPKKSAAIKDLAIDDIGVHPHKITELCVKDACEQQKCNGGVCFIMSPTEQELWMSSNDLYKYLMEVIPCYTRLNESDRKLFLSYFTDYITMFSQHYRSQIIMRILIYAL